MGGWAGAGDDRSGADDAGLFNGEYSTLIARDILHEGVPEIPPDIPLAVAAQIMLDKG